MKRESDILCVYNHRAREPGGATIRVKADDLIALFRCAEMLGETSVHIQQPGVVDDIGQALAKVPL